MVVATNVLALNSHRNLKGVGQKQSLASQRLSSGYRINSAADDAAGLAISEKMRAQIRGLDQASTNAQDAISLIQTAEGGMQEIDNMVQRIRELVVQASNDTNDYDTDDRQKIQDEIQQLLAEIDSMAERVEFNQKAVIDGSYEGTLVAGAAGIETRFNTTKAALDQAMARLDNGKEDVSKANDTLATNRDTVATEIENALSELDTLAYAQHLQAFVDSVVNDILANVGTGATNYSQASADAVLDAAEKLQNGINDLMDALNGVDGYADIAKAQAALADIGAVGTATTLLGAVKDANDNLKKGSDNTAIAANTNLTAALNDIANNYFVTGKKAFDALQTGSALETAAKAVDTARLDLGVKENRIAGLQSRVDTARDTYRTAWKDYVNAEREGGLYFQIGANSDQGIHVQIGSVKTDLLGIGNGSERDAGDPTIIDVMKESGDEITGLLDILDDALSYVTTQRSKLGAVQNRLEYTINSLDISSENLSAAESRIRDTDMAKEMMNLTQANVLQQAATSMLAQANSAPQSILQLLS